MKIIIFCAAFLLYAYAKSFSQSKTPDAVSAAFNQKFPAATEIKWDKENAHEYEASFKWEGLNNSANFNESGEWLETESDFSFNKLPEKVQRAYNTSHQGATVKNVTKIETSKGVTNFELEIKKGVRTVELLYSIEGTEIN